jgi:hypothetical protein
MIDNAARDPGAVRKTSVAMIGRRDRHPRSLGTARIVRPEHDVPGAHG